MKKIIFALLVASLLLGCSDSREQARSRSKNEQSATSAESVADNRIDLTDGQEKSLATMLASGWLKIKARENRAEVSQVVWRSFDYDAKEGLCYCLAVKCGNDKGTQLYWVDVYDIDTGKKLAKYSRSWGFKVY